MTIGHMTQRLLAISRIPQSAYGTPTPTNTPLATPGAPTAAAGATGLLTGDYIYTVTFVTATGETHAGTRSAPLTVAAKQVDLSNIPVGGGSVTKRRIYRTKAGGAAGTEQLVTTITDNVATTYTDNTPDASLGAAVPVQNTSAQLNYSQLVVRDQNLSDYQVATRDNKGYATGQNWPTEQWTISHDASRAIEIEPSTDTLGRLLRYGLGSVATLQPNAVGAPTLYRHSFTPQDMSSSRQLPPASIVERVGAIINDLFPGMCVTGFTLRGEGVDKIMLSVQFRGSGKRTSPSGVTFAADNTNNVNPAINQKYFFNSQVSLTMADYQALTNAINYGATKRIESWSVAVTNTPLADDGYRPGSADFQTAGDQTSGAIRSELLTGDQDIVVEFVVRMDSASDEYAKLQAQTPLDMSIVLTGPAIAGGYNHKLTIHAPLSSYAAITKGNKNGIVTLNIRARLMWDLLLQQVVTFVLDNETASYTV